MDNIFSSIFDTSTSTMSAGDFFLCLAVALVSGIILALLCSYKNSYTKSFVITLALLPAIVTLIIIMVNGNIGTGIAVAGAFSLVRFRSAPGTAKEICAIFIAMAAGLALGMGYLAYALIFVIVMGALVVLLTVTKFGERKMNMKDKLMKITISEDLDYTTIFDEVFKEYTEKAYLVKVKTINMGSMYKLTYSLKLKDENKEKELIDKIRCRNGNLEVVSSRKDSMQSEL